MKRIQKIIKVCLIIMLITLVTTLVVNAYYKAEKGRLEQEVLNYEIKIQNLKQELAEIEMEEIEELEFETDKVEDSNSAKALKVVDAVTYEVIDVMEITATAYCHCEECCGKTPDDPAYGITKSGLDLLAVGADTRIVAADTRVLPLGTKIYIEVPEASRYDQYVTEDYGIASVEDIGGGIKGNRIDVYFSTHQEACEWGVREVQVYVIVPVS